MTEVVALMPMRSKRNSCALAFCPIGANVCATADVKNRVAHAKACARSDQLPLARHQCDAIHALPAKCE